MKNLESKTDEELLELMQNKNKNQAFSELYFRYAKKFFRTGLEITKNFEDAEDILQNSFIKIYNNIKKYKKDFKLKSWMGKIVKNESINIYKKNKINPLRNPLPLQDNRGNNENYLERKEIANIIKTELKKINPKYREAYELIEFKGIKYEEASKKLHVNVNQVKSFVYCAKTKMKENILLNYGKNFFYQ